MSDHVILIHGDLLTKERLDTVRNSRRIEHTPKNRFQYVIFLPGLCHYKMACADAICRTYIQPKEGRDDENSLYQHTAVLWPEETGKMAESQNPEWSTLENFAVSEPKWDDVVAMSHTIVWKYPSTGCDKQFENQMLRNRDELMYIDVLEASFLPWIYVFKATGKHKYASQMIKFLVNLHDIIRMNLLCNPSGHALVFRAVDWVVERNNLYTKVIYRGGGPNGTIEHIIKESPLIKVYRNCHIIIENGFHLQHQTIRHAQPDMTNTICKLSMRIKEKYTRIKTFGRKALWSIPDQINEGMALMQEQTITKFVGRCEGQ
ncbi:hypothetical protein BD769DRAFT_1632408 [Suillus cothurnatus]|nr:hypothetical protein BD769DRAFT_1632408 [Suillus cothurnatus]